MLQSAIRAACGARIAYRSHSCPFQSIPRASLSPMTDGCPEICSRVWPHRFSVWNKAPCPDMHRVSLWYLVWQNRPGQCSPDVVTDHILCSISSTECVAIHASHSSRSQERYWGRSGGCPARHDLRAQSHWCGSTRSTGPSIPASSSMEYIMRFPCLVVWVSTSTDGYGRIQ